jgi:hypothetical protein
VTDRWIGVEKRRYPGRLVGVGVVDDDSDGDQLVQVRWKAPPSGPEDAAPWFEHTHLFVFTSGG